MTPVKCHSQPTQCAYIGLWRGGAARPLRTPTAARLSPARGRAGGVAPLLPGGALTADSPHRGCRRPRVVGEARRPAKVAAFARGLAWPDTLPPARKSPADRPFWSAVMVRRMLSLDDLKEYVQSPVLELAELGSGSRAVIVRRRGLSPRLRTSLSHTTGPVPCLGSASFFVYCLQSLRVVAHHLR